MLLAALESGGALARLPAAATAAAFSHAQQLAAAGAALELLPELAAAAQDGGAGARARCRGLPGAPVRRRLLRWMRAAPMSRQPFPDPARR